jgi:hypothetical protein
MAATARLASWRDELAWWQQKELPALERGLRQLQRLLERALREPELEEEEDAAAYYGGLVASYKRKVREARRSIAEAARVWVALASEVPRPRAREPRSPSRRRARTSTSASAKDPPDDPSDESDLARPAFGGRLGVEVET